MRLGLAALLSLAACSGDFCAQLQGVPWTSIASACTDAGLPAGASCEQQLSQCSGSDRASLSSYAHCLSSLPACAPAQRAQWAQELGQCQALLETVSPSCPFYLGVRAPVGTTDGGCTLNDDCPGVQCPCTDIDGGSEIFQQCVSGTCNGICPELFCCAGLGLGPGAQCASPCDCASSVCNAGACE